MKKNHYEVLKKHFHLLLVIGLVFGYSAQCWKMTIVNFDYSKLLPPDHISALEYFTSIITTVQNSWSKNLYYQNKIDQINESATYLVVGNVTSDQVSVGTGGWIFYTSKSDGNSIADYEGTECYTDEDIQKRSKLLLNVQNGLTAHGIQFCLIIPPNKEHIYSEYMSRQYKHSEATRTDMLIAEFKRQGINAINPKDVLLNNHNAFQLYYRYDTHWNQLGGYLGAKLALQSFGMEIPDLSEVSICSGQKSTMRDLARIAGINALVHEEAEYAVKGLFQSDLSQFQAENSHGFGTYYVNNEAIYNKKVLLVGDSFTVAMVPALVNYCSEVFVIHRDICKPEILDSLSPDCVIVEYVERYFPQLISLPYLGFNS